MDAETKRRILADPVEFRRHLLTDCNGTPRYLGEVMDAWQDRDFRALDAGWKRIAGRDDGGGEVKLRGYLERPRGHSKTTDNAAMATYGLMASRQKQTGVWVAGDRDQARLGRNAIDTLRRMNRLVADTIEVQNYRIVNRHTGSELEILSSDAPTSYGLLFSWCLCDEITTWASRDLWDSVFSAAAKRECMFLVLSNAGSGKGTSWQWKVREACRTNPAWYFSRLDGPQASWITAASLAEQQAILPTKPFARLWLNEWQTTLGDALEETDLLASIPQPAHDQLPMPGPMTGPHPDFSICAGLDVGVKRDFTGFCGIASNAKQQRIRLAFEREWKPEPSTGQVDLQDVEDQVAEASKHWGLTAVYFDPSQADFLAQRLRRRGVNMVEVPFTAGNLNRMASALVEVFKSRRIDLYQGCKLFGQFQRVSIQERPPHGLKLDFPRDKESGHQDLACAACIAIPFAIDATASGHGRTIVLEQGVMFGNLNQTVIDPVFGRRSASGIF